MPWNVQVESFRHPFYCVDNPKMYINSNSRCAVLHFWNSNSNSIKSKGTTEKTQRRQLCKIFQLQIQFYSLCMCAHSHLYECQINIWPGVFQDFSSSQLSLLFICCVYYIASNDWRFFLSSIFFWRRAKHQAHIYKLTISVLLLYVLLQLWAGFQPNSFQNMFWNRRSGALYFITT